MIADHIAQAIVEARKLALDTFLASERARIETYADVLQAILSRIERLEAECRK